MGKRLSHSAEDQAACSSSPILNFPFLISFVSLCLRGLNFRGRDSQQVADQSTADANEGRSGNSAIGWAECVFSSQRRLIHTQGMFNSLHTAMS